MIAANSTTKTDTYMGKVGVAPVEKVTNGSMEADANWTSIGTPETNERSSTYARGETYSRHCVDSTPSTGGFYQDLTTTATKSYFITLWYYLVSGTLIVQFSKGDYSAWLWTSSDLTTAGAWTQVTATQVQSTSGASTRIWFINKSAVAGAEFYIDDVTVREL